MNQLICEDENDQEVFEPTTNGLVRCSNIYQSAMFNKLSYINLKNSTSPLA